MPDLELFLQTLIAGFLLGGLYGLIALGMALIMGVMRVINLAHGDFMMIAMYIAYWLFTLFEIDPYLSVFVAAPALFLFGLAIQKYLLTPVMKVESILPHNLVILTVGLAMVFSNLATVFFHRRLSVNTGKLCFECLVSDGLLAGFSHRTVPFHAVDIVVCHCGYYHNSPMDIPHQDGYGEIHQSHIAGPRCGAPYGRQCKPRQDGDLRYRHDLGCRCRLSFHPYLLSLPGAGETIYERRVRYYGHRRHGFNRRGYYRRVNPRYL